MEAPADACACFVQLRKIVIGNALIDPHPTYAILHLRQLALETRLLCFETRHARWQLRHLPTRLRHLFTKIAQPALKADLVSSKS